MTVTECGPRLHWQEPEMRASGRKQTESCNLYLIAKGIQALPFRTSTKRAFFLWAQPQWLRMGIWSVALIILLAPTTSLPVSLIISLSKWEKMELCDPLDLSPLPYWQAPLILELRPHLLNSGAHLESPTNQWQSELQSISPNVFPSFPQPDSTSYLLGKTGSYGEGTCLCRK